VVGAGSVTVTASMALVHQRLYGQPMPAELVGAWSITAGIATEVVREYSSWARHRDACLAGRAQWLTHASLRWLVASPARYQDTDLAPAGVDEDGAGQELGRRWWPVYPWLVEKWSLAWATGGPVAWWVSDAWWAARLDQTDVQDGPRAVEAIPRLGNDSTGPQAQGHENTDCQPDTEGRDSGAAPGQRVLVTGGVS
jgi:hypothetical protein